MSIDCSEFIKLLLPYIDGKGGGSATMATGVGKNILGIDEMLKQAEIIFQKIANEEKNNE